MPEMPYHEYLATLVDCPFCVEENRNISENETCFLTYAAAPYAPDHLLVIPRRHVEHFPDLTPTECADIDDLLRMAVNILARLGVSNYSLLLRDGEGLGKSVAHLHYHIIPSVPIGACEGVSADRPMLDSGEVDALLRRYKGAIGSL